MLHFQISPPKTIGTSLVPCKEESSIPVYLVLGAFAAVPKIHFETVKMGQSRKRTLIVRNPSDQVAWLKLVKKPSSAFQISWDTDLQIQPNGQCVLDITWTPTEEGQCFQAFQIQSSLAGIKFSVHLLGVCSPPQRYSRLRPLVSSQNIQTNSSQAKMSGPRSGDSGVTVVSTSCPREKTPQNLSGGMSNISINASESSTITSDYTSAKPDLTPTTPQKGGLSASDILDSFAFPFTPDARAKRSETNITDCNASSGLRRETFLVEEDSQFLQGQTTSPTRRETYLVAPNNTAELSELRLDFEDEELANLASELDALLSKIDGTFSKHST